MTARQAVALQADGKIVAVGSAYPGGANNQFALARYNRRRQPGCELRRRRQGHDRFLRPQRPRPRDRPAGRRQDRRRGHGLPGRQRDRRICARPLQRRRQPRHQPSTATARQRPVFPGLHPAPVGGGPGGRQDRRGELGGRWRHRFRRVLARPLQHRWQPGLRASAPAAGSRRTSSVRRTRPTRSRCRPTARSWPRVRRTMPASRYSKFALARYDGGSGTAPGRWRFRRWRSVRPAWPAARRRPAP